MRQEVDIRYVVTSLKGSAQHLYKKTDSADPLGRAEFATIRERLIKIAARGGTMGTGGNGIPHLKIGARDCCMSCEPPHIR
jgi:hypothetical protein